MKKIGHKFIDGVELKRCSHCKEWQELNCFYKNKGTCDKLSFQCRDCVKQYNINSIEKRKQHYIDNVERAIWYGMIRRCYNPKRKDYKYYGGMGITVCDLWLNSFDAFFEDMGKRPTPKHTIERKDNNKGYSPENCCWATWEEQALNRRPASYGKAKRYWFRAWHKDSMAQYMSNNQNTFAKENGLNNTCISDCLRGKIKQHRGWTFQKIN